MDTVTFDNGIVQWFEQKIVDRVWKVSFYSAMVLSIIMVIALFLCKFSLSSPIYSFIGILSPLLQPITLTVTLLFIFLATFGQAFIIATLYRAENLNPSPPAELLMGCDFNDIKAKLFASFSLALINGFVTVTIWNLFVAKQGIDYSMSLSLLLAALVTSMYVVFCHRSYALILNGTKTWAKKDFSYRSLHPQSVYSYVKSHEFLSICHSAAQAGVLLQVALNFVILILGCLPLLGFFVAGFDAQFHIFLFNFAQILTGLYLHLFVRHFLTEPMVFQFPERYEIANPSSEQKANMRAVLHSSNVFLQMFAFHHLVTLQMPDWKERREAIFELSIPGNNPLNWNSISRACLHQIHSMIDEIDGARRRLGLPAFNRADDSDEEDFINRSMMMMPPNQRSQMYTMSARRRQNAHLRRKSTPAPVYSPEVSETYISPYAARTLLLAIEGIIGLLICSLEEDRYGVVQKDRPAVLRAIIQLATTIDKYIREKKAISTPDGIDMTWICEIEANISRSLNTFHASFKNYVGSLGFSTEEHRVYTQIVLSRICTE